MKLGSIRNDMGKKKKEKKKYEFFFFSFIGYFVILFYCGDGWSYMDF